VLEFISGIANIVATIAGLLALFPPLDRLSKEWQARAERGEIPQTTPGGPRVWQNEVEAETQGT
jgi:hypothetical protein